MADTCCGKGKMSRERSGGSGVDVSTEGCHPLSSPAAVIADQDGEETGREALISEHEAAGWRRGGVSGPLPCTSPSAPRPTEEVLLRNFHIPRKSKEQKDLFQYFPADSREFKDIVKILSSSYLESSSMGTFSYAKARLVHSQLLENDFCEKRREMKQEGRTDSELQESYGFLLTDISKLPDICEKGLHVGHSRDSMLGNPAMGVSLARFSDLLQINTFSVGAAGEIIIFKIIKGKVKNVFKSNSKAGLDPSPGFDCHMSKKSSCITSLHSYRAFEITQQYFYEYSFDSVRQRPRHVCPYAVVSFVYKGRKGAPSPKPAAPPRPVNSSSEDCGGGVPLRSRYVVWSGQLLNGGRVVSQVSLCSSARAFLPFKLPEILEIDTAMHLDKVKEKIPPSLLSWNTFRGTSEVVRSGFFASLFEVEDTGKGSLMAVLLKLEREKMVLVKPLIDKGFLFLLSSTQMHCPNDQSRDWTWRLQALFVFQESRGVKRRVSRQEETPSHGSEVISGLESFLPALQYAQSKLRTCDPPNVAAGIERQARDYLCRQRQGKVRPIHLSEYKQSLDNLEKPWPAPRNVRNLDGRLQAYLRRPGTYALSLKQARDMVTNEAPPHQLCPRERGPLVDSGRAKDRVASVKRAVAKEQGPPQGEYDLTMMNQLLRMIKHHKRNQGGLPVEPVGKGKDMGAAGTHGLKRKLEDESTGRPPKRVQKRGSKSSPAQVKENQACRPPSPPDLSTSIGERDSDLRRQDCDLRELRSDAGEQALETQQLFEILLTTLSQAATPASPTDQGNSLDGPMGGKKNKGKELGSADPGDLLDLMDLGLPLGHDIDLRRRLRREPQHKARKRSQAGQVKSTSSDQPKEESFLPWRLAPITGLSLKRFCPPVNPNSHDPRFQKVPGAVVQACGGRAQCSLSQDTNVRQEGEVAGGSVLDAVVDTEYIKFSEEMQDILKGERVRYRPKSPWPRPYLQQLAFSDYITHHVPPVSTEHYVSMLRQDMNRVIGSQPAPAPCSTHPTNPQAATPKTSPHPRLLSVDGVKEGEDACIRTESLPDQLKAQRKKPFGDGSPTLDPAPVPIPVSISSLIGQVKPEVLSSLVEIIKDVHKNTVKFYIHPGSQTSGPEHCQIKEYLKSLGNVEGDPETFLKNSSSLEKLLVIIENQDIAACLHKIPALLSLKSLSRVSFVGVDGPDDLRNHTSNELFVSGGIIVSDEFLLDPDFITHERLQALLTSLMGRSSLENQWHWKIHCKTKKKLKELGSRNSKALLLFNLLCSSRWRHLVEFLPYHDCDAAGRQAPDLSCLIQLQAQNTQRRHAVFLTERRAEMFPGYSNNGILVASIDDIMYRFDDLMGTCDRMVESPSSVPPAESVAECSVEWDALLKGEDMCLDPTEGNPTVPLEDAGQPPLPPAEEFRPPLPETVDMELPLPGQLAPDHRPKAETCLSEDRDFNALKYAISQFKASSQVTEQMLVLEQGVASFDPYHSFLGPTLPWTPPSGCLGTPSQQWGYRSVPSQYYPLPGQQGSLQLPFPSPAVFPTSSLGSAHLPGEGAMELWVSQQQANQNWARL